MVKSYLPSKWGAKKHQFGWRLGAACHTSLHKWDTLIVSVQAHSSGHQGRFFWEGKGGRRSQAHSSGGRRYVIHPMQAATKSYRGKSHSYRRRRLAMLDCTRLGRWGGGRARGACSRQHHIPRAGHRLQTVL
ncbi:hypothetical protein F751_4621 [Auxenochlorella protothecoides]|uniref:Uncharacterized protein n=1 Tax=Auxenochlorella protothecoides TaxID=3075 RepID=A0A087SNP7_AUXPR|nr:hypothetical protein F751_4621 [Auxenochlorella protothecoides]KFM27351.1 hypothetical protein F751_4621 [Auxenochlorella protothecoides]